MDSPSTPPQPPARLTIGDLAERTGVAVSTLRVWESRHDFPRPHRLPNGHRRFTEHDVDLVSEVERRRAAGLRLDAAIAEVTQAPPATAETTSVFATLRRAHPGNPVRVLRKATLLGLSWAIEDEFAAKAERTHLFGAFQEEANYASAAARWSTLARAAASAHVFVGPGSLGVPEAPGAPHRVVLDDRHPMRREWAVVCDGGELPIALSAWEVPGQEHVADGDRLFESVWTAEPGAVRTAARACARAAVEAGRTEARAVVRALEAPAPPPVLDAEAVTALVTRILGYVDRATAPRGATHGVTT